LDFGLRTPIQHPKPKIRRYGKSHHGVSAAARLSERSEGEHIVYGSAAVTFPRGIRTAFSVYALRDVR
jgi:hypothetical protein